VRNPYAFQFPLSERTNCNTVIKSVNLTPDTSFSFLYRNERTATSIVRDEANSSPRFQFPLSERTNCNCCFSRLRSCCGFSFSFLYRNERTATKLHRRVEKTDSTLSVSSIGTNELQPQKSKDMQISYITFQFPLSERTNCNVSVLFRQQIFRFLSVSSIGTNELQHEASTRLSRSSFSFSFLYRNERTATRVEQSFPRYRPIFQFPLSERTNCNSRLVRSVRATPTSFSFLYRNERTATLLWERV